MDREAKLHPPLPKITISGSAANHVYFSDWKIEMSHLSGIERYSGNSMIWLSYKVTRDGVLQDTGGIAPPTGGKSIMSHEPMAIDVYLPKTPDDKTEVEIIADGD